MKPRILLSQSIVKVTTSAIFDGMKTGRLIHSPMMPLMIDLQTLETIIVEGDEFICYQSVWGEEMKVHTERLKL
jgi:hypothetical protein